MAFSGWHGLEGNGSSHSCGYMDVILSVGSTLPCSTVLRDKHVVSIKPCKLGIAKEDVCFECSCIARVFVHRCQ